MPSTGVTLAWDPSTDATVTGYKIYAGLISGVYTDINSPMSVGNVTTATYTVTVGGTWYFAITAVSPSGESGFSNEVSVFVDLDTTPPLVTILSPTADPVYASPFNAIILSGVAADVVGVVSVTWANTSAGTSGAATGTTTWTTPTIALIDGPNTIVITAFDLAGNAGTDSLLATIVQPDIRVASSPRGIYMVRGYR